MSSWSNETYFYPILYEFPGKIFNFRHPGTLIATRPDSARFTRKLNTGTWIKKTLVHEFLISCSHTEWYLFFRRCNYKCTMCIRIRSEKREIVLSCPIYFSYSRVSSYSLLMFLSFLLFPFETHMHEFRISYSHTEWYFLFSDSATTSAQCVFGAKSLNT